MKNIFLSTLLIIAIVSCKKKDKDPPANNGGSGTGTSTTGGTTTTGGVNPSTATSFHGILTIGNYASSFGTFSITSSSARAYFSSMATQYMNPSTSVKAGQIYLNNDSLPYSNQNNYYTTTTPVNLAAATWSVSGGNGIPAFKHAVTNAVPVYGIVNFPDTISKTNTFTLAVNSVSAQIALLFIMDGSSSMVKYTTPLKNGNNTLTITPANMQTLQSGTGSIIMSLQNTYAVSVSKKDFQISQEAQNFRQIVIKP